MSFDVMSCHFWVIVSVLVKCDKTGLAVGCLLSPRMRRPGQGRGEKVNTCGWRLEAATLLTRPAMHVILAHSQANNISLPGLGRNGSYTVPPGHRDGGLPLISDSLFSLIIMLYVLLAFVFVFFLFCWRRGPESPLVDKVSPAD